jgi:hypothetical protein
MRVEANAGADPKWYVLGKECGLSADECFGKVVRLWGRVIELRDDGDLSKVPDDTLEDWANYKGKPGRFAKAYRKLCTTDWQIKGWHDYQGKLIARRASDRARKAAERPRLVREKSA